jgi:hypothetical protein
MLHWYCRVYDSNGDWTAYCVYGNSESYVVRILSNYVTDVEGYEPDEFEIECEMWDTFTHGDYQDYEILS